MPRVIIDETVLDHQKKTHEYSCFCQAISWIIPEDFENRGGSMSSDNDFEIISIFEQMVVHAMTYGKLETSEEEPQQTSHYEVPVRQ